MSALNRKLRLRPPGDYLPWTPLQASIALGVDLVLVVGFVAWLVLS